MPETERTGTLHQYAGYQIERGNSDRESYFICGVCGRKFRVQYGVKNRRSQKVYGTGQLMYLWAGNNFDRHQAACRKKRCALCLAGDKPHLRRDGFHYHDHGRARCTAFQVQGKEDRPAAKVYEENAGA